MPETNDPPEQESNFVQAFIEHYENARMDGLCHEGAWEVALGKVTLPPDVMQWVEELLR